MLTIQMQQVRLNSFNPNFTLECRTHSMSGQKYRRTNFEEDEDGDSVVPQCVSPMEEANGSAGGSLTTPSGSGFLYMDSSVTFKSAASMYHRRSKLERSLIVAVIILAVLTLVLAIIIGTHEHVDVDDYEGDNKGKAVTKQELCTSKVCITVASTMLNSMNEEVDPCEDFYEYACGGWIKSHPIPAGEARWDAFGVLKQGNQIVLRNVLASPTNESLSKAELMARQYFNSCMDSNQVIEKLGADPLLSLMKDFGGWAMGPLPGEKYKGMLWNPMNWNFQDMLEEIHELGLSNFFSMWVEADEKNPNINVLKVDQGGLVLQREQYLNKSIEEDKILSAYLEFMIELGKLLGATDVNETKAQFIEVLELERAIANISSAPEDRRDDEEMYNNMTLQELQRRSPFIDWKHYVNHMLSVVNYTVNMNERIIVYEPEYLTLVSNLVLDLMQKPNGNRTIHNYIVWHLVKMMSQFLSKPFKEVRKEFLRVITGIVGEEEKWRYCTGDTDSVLGLALGAMYVRQTFHGESKKSAEIMVKNIKSAFISNLRELSWMDKETKQAAAEKAQAVVEMIGFPEFILNASALDMKYKGLKINESEYFLNNYRAIKFNSKKNLEKLRKQPDNTTWSMTPPTVNAYYQPTKNQIVFPAGILQRPFYDKDFPKSLNYGAMGVVMGHELTHGFDDQGREYDRYGYLRSWWNESVVERFKNQTQCMTEQYSKYTSFGEHLKGKQTLGENIADNGGLKSAYTAYENWLKENKVKEEPALPGLNFTHRQLFFLAFSQVWCSNSRAEDNHNAIISDPHSMPRFRVLGTLSNSREFSKHFKCHSGATMNPVNKCVVW